jgi:hypothetical protein
MVKYVKLLQVRTATLSHDTDSPQSSCTAVHILGICHDNVWVILDLGAFHNIHTEYTENPSKVAIPGTEVIAKVPKPRFFSDTWSKPLWINKDVNTTSSHLYI